MEENVQSCAQNGATNFLQTQVQDATQVKNDTQKNSIVILGPTATGKTSLAVALARKFSGEYLSADSRQVYKGLDIGSGKDLCEFCATENLPAVPYHLIDIAELCNEITKEYNVFNYQQDFYAVFADVTRRKKLPIITGGTGMYLDAIIRSYNFIDVPQNKELREELAKLSIEDLGKRLLSHRAVHNQTDLTERPRLVRAIEIAEYELTQDAKAKRLELANRPKVNAFILGLTFPRETLRKRIRVRLEERIKCGMIEEVENLHKNGASFERLTRLGLEYRFCAEYLQGKITKEEMTEKLAIAIGQFAKRQETWFRGMQKKGVVINWIETSANMTKEEVLEKALKMLSGVQFVRGANA